MSLETATYLADLQPANPPSTDPTSQGDDHLRLIKQVLQTTFPGGSRVYPVPTTLAKTANYTIVKNDGEGVIYVSTAGGAVTLTLPTLAAVDQGWKINFIKTSLDVNPVFISPAAGTLNSGGYAGLARARRCIPGARSTAVWDGAAWFVTRVSPAPIGVLLDFYGSTLPAGYEWPNGQTLASVATNYPEYNAAVGSGLTPDIRGRTATTLDTLGGLDASRLTTSPSIGAGRNTLGTGGGLAGVGLVVGNIPAVTPTGTNTQPSVSFSINTRNSNYQVVGGGSVPLADTSALNGTTTAIASPSAVSVSGGGWTPNSIYTASPSAHENMPPTLICGKILVVE